MHCTKRAPALDAAQSQDNAEDGIEIRDGVGSCGHAASTLQRVVVEDIRSHPNWKPFRALVRRTDLQACWSEPIFSTTGTLVGTFALYLILTIIAPLVVLHGVALWAQHNLGFEYLLFDRTLQFVGDTQACWLRIDR